MKTAYTNECVVYSFNPKEGTDQRPLKLDFYEHPDESIRILRDLLHDDKQDANYIRAFAESEFPGIDEIGSIDDVGEQTRIRRRRPRLTI